MRALRAVGGFVFELCSLLENYSDCSISYNKEEIEEIRLHHNTKSMPKSAQRNLSQKMKPASS